MFIQKQCLRSAFGRLTRAASAGHREAAGASGVEQQAQDRCASRSARAQDCGADHLQPRRRLEPARVRPRHAPCGPGQPRHQQQPPRGEHAIARRGRNVRLLRPPLLRPLHAPHQRHIRVARGDTGCRRGVCGRAAGDPTATWGTRPWPRRAYPAAQRAHHPAPRGGRLLGRGCRGGAAAGSLLYVCECAHGARVAPDTAAHPHRATGAPHAHVRPQAFASMRRAASVMAA